MQVGLTTPLHYIMQLQHKYHTSAHTIQVRTHGEQYQPIQVPRRRLLVGTETFPNSNPLWETPITQ